MTTYFKEYRDQVIAEIEKILNGKLKTALTATEEHSIEDSFEKRHYPSSPAEVIIINRLAKEKEGAK